MDQVVGEAPHFGAVVDNADHGVASREERPAGRGEDVHRGTGKGSFSIEDMIPEFTGRVVYNTQFI